MIDEYWTWIFYGYHSDELSYGSGRPIVAMCDDCCRYAILKYRDYHDHCYQCSTKHRPPHTEETKLKMSKSATGIKRNFSKESYPDMSEARRNYRHSPESRQKIAESNTGNTMSPEARQKLSAWHQGVSIEEWEGFASNKEYCDKFNETCKEHNREKYGRQCFICGVDEETDGRKLSVHHVDMNKDQGCNDHDWNLVPMCMSCHTKSHSDIWTSRIEYLLEFVWK